MIAKRLRVQIAMLSTALLVHGCAPMQSSSPSTTEALLASAPAVRSEWVRGEGFEHRVYRRGRVDAGTPLHVYLEGDGRPWKTPTQRSTDPTPRNPLALKLMLRDPKPSVYIGRPCYHGRAEAPGCSPMLWTDRRYSEAVVSSMARALERVAGRERDLVLIGYSGGGTLAMLLAPRFEHVLRVITLAGNMDTDAWAAHQSFTPLTGSLNPVDQPPLEPDIEQLHLAGGDDRLVPPWVPRRVAHANPGSSFVVVPGFDHGCCWVEQWPGLMDGAAKPSR